MQLLKVNLTETSTKMNVSTILEAKLERRNVTDHDCKGAGKGGRYKDNDNQNDADKNGAGGGAAVLKPAQGNSSKRFNNLSCTASCFCTAMPRSFSS